MMRRGRGPAARWNAAAEAARRWRLALPPRPGDIEMRDPSPTIVREPGKSRPAEKKKGARRKAG